jgi:hypothetical protein
MNRRTSKTLPRFRLSHETRAMRLGVRRFIAAFDRATITPTQRNPFAP